MSTLYKTLQRQILVTNHNIKAIKLPPQVLQTKYMYSRQILPSQDVKNAFLQPILVSLKSSTPLTSFYPNVVKEYIVNRNEGY